MDLGQARSFFFSDSNGDSRERALPNAQCVDIGIYSWRNRESGVSIYSEGEIVRDSLLVAKTDLSC